MARRTRHGKRFWQAVLVLRRSWRAVQHRARAVDKRLWSDPVTQAVLIVLILSCAAAAVRAQTPTSPVERHLGYPPATRHPLAQAVKPPAPGTPVSFLADTISYDKTNDIVTAQGHVRAWQNGQTLYADEVALNRKTGVATAIGHVIITLPTGESVYANNAVLSNGMKNAVMQGVAARLAQNGRMIANGARRYNADIEQLSKAVYSTCNLCQTNPKKPPLWQIRASSVTRDLQHKRIEYTDAVMQIHGLPVFYFPYMSQPDPSVKRQTGLLIPSIGSTSQIGFFTMVPYYIVINGATDLTLTPIIAAKAGPVLDAKYRQDFNNGVLAIDLSGGRDRAHNGSGNSELGSSVFANGVFDLNQDWRGGFSYNRASSAQYLDDFNFEQNVAYLSSTAYLEGFGQGSYARIETDTYQGLVSSVSQNTLPIVLPYGQYHFDSAPDAIGGRFGISADAFNVYRDRGSHSRRVSLIGNYALPFNGLLGQIWLARVRLISAGYGASDLNQQPNFSAISRASAARAVPFGALLMRWPFIRAAQAGNQIVEPEVQFVSSPNIGISQNDRIPNEDSLDLEFSDANLFALHRYPGIDRIAGGSRVDYAMHAAWYLPHGALLDGILGESYAFHKNHDYLPGSGLSDNWSDIVGRATVAPAPWFNVTYRTRLSHRSLGVRMIDTTASLGNSRLNFSGGYLYANTNPYVLYNQPYQLNVPSSFPAAFYTPRKDVTFNVTTNFGAWSVSGGTERNLQTGKFDTATASLGWQNECTAISLIYYERFTSYNLDNGNTTILVQFTFKTLGNVGFNAL
jgi:LPS-assembly protein